MNTTKHTQAGAAPRKKRAKKGGMTHISVSLPADLVAWAKKEAHRKQLTLSAFIRTILEDRRVGVGK